MTEEIKDHNDIENTEGGSADHSSQPRKDKQAAKATGGKKKGKTGKSREFSRAELTLISLTGFIGFCGILFCVIMITLLNSIGY